MGEDAGVGRTMKAPASNRATVVPVDGVSPLMAAVMNEELRRQGGGERKEAVIDVEQFIEETRKKAISAMHAEGILAMRDNQGNLLNLVKGVGNLFNQWTVLCLLLYQVLFWLVLEEYVPEKGSGGFQAYIDHLGWIVALLVTFRQNQAMNRFWTANTAWGELGVACRDAVRVMASQNLNMNVSTNFAMYAIAFTITSKNFLRDDASFDKEELKDVLTQQELEYVDKMKGLERPLGLLDMMSGEISKAIVEGSIDQTSILVLERNMEKLNSNLGQAQRVKLSPLPYMYIVVLDLVLIVFLLSMPFYLVAYKCEPWLVFLISTILNLVLNGLSKLGRQIESPFGKDPNDLPLGAHTADTVNQIVKILDRWYDPNSPLQVGTKKAAKKLD